VTAAGRTLGSACHTHPIRCHERASQNVLTGRGRQPQITPCRRTRARARRRPHWVQPWRGGRPSLAGRSCQASPRSGGTPRDPAPARAALTPESSFRSQGGPTRTRISSPRAPRRSSRWARVPCGPGRLALRVPAALRRPAAAGQAPARRPPPLPPHAAPDQADNFQPRQRRRRKVLGRGGGGAGPRRQHGQPRPARRRARGSARDAPSV
jgi:hypothetical protein